MYSFAMKLIHNVIIIQVDLIKNVNKRTNVKTLIRIFKKNSLREALFYIC